MKKNERLLFAARVMRRAWAWLPLISMAVCGFCLCLAGSLYAHVAKQKSEPCELVVQAGPGSSITDARVADIAQIPEVIGASATLSVPATIVAGEYSLELALTGIDSAYLQGDVVAGARYPDQTVMPYVLVNEAALKAFRDDEGNPLQAEGQQQVDLLSLQARLKDSESPIKLCGVLRDQSEVPKAYLSRERAKGLMLEPFTQYPEACVRLKDAGSMEAALKALSAIGLQVVEASSQDADWTVKQMQALYLLLMGLWTLVCTCIVFTVLQERDVRQNARAYTMLYGVGFAQRDLTAHVFFQTGWIYLAGCLIGVAIHLVLPYLIVVEQDSILLLAPSALTIAAVFVLCTVSACVCGVASKRRCGRLLFVQMA